ncbi:hypothetical protein [Pseudomonas sp. FYR_7]|uniref:hypothetical protein n=1 Tax=Pseudomonas sp. FYR_7 TaxID=3367174 RepID=UPI00370BB3A5
MDTNQMRDTSREQFEAWARDENKWLIDRDSFGNYIYGFVRDSWNSWQASREAVVVDWPDQHTYTAPDCAGAAILDCRTAFGKAMRVTP